MRPQYRRRLFMQQKDAWCGPACLQSVLAGYGERVAQADLAILMDAHPVTGASEKKFLSVARKTGLRASFKRHATLADLRRAVRTRRAVVIGYCEPAYDESHWAMAVAASSRSALLDDPWNGPSFRLPWRTFRRRWSRESGWLAVLWPRTR